ncbi:hypothetical protein ID866_7695, partial [Astraeus odoratus]
EEAISPHQQALELHPVGHPNRSSSLSDLAACIQCRYDSQRELGDLEEVISLHQQALELCLIGIQIGHHLWVGLQIAFN